MWNDKKKAITFSFDDGVTQDVRLIEILNKYDLKATFNLNSALFGVKNEHFYCNEKVITHNKVSVADVRKIYSGHEIAVHTLSHPNLTDLDDASVIYQVEADRKMLSDLAGYEVVGMAYPCGGVNNNDRVAELIKNNTGVKYARTITSTHDFSKQKNLFRFNPSVYYIEKDFEKIVDEFLNAEVSNSDEGKLLYIWGHSYEMDGGFISWENFERICRKLSRKNDVFYGTNKEVLL